MIAEALLFFVCVVCVYVTVVAPSPGPYWMACFVIALCAGIIVDELRRIRGGIMELVNLAKASPDDTAAAMRRAVRPSPAEEKEPVS
jgi:hypothetical protein